MEKNNIISDWLDQYGNPEIDKFVETQLNQNKMTAVEWLEEELKANLKKVILEGDSELMESLFEQAKEMEKEQKIEFAKMHVKTALKAVENEMILHASSVKHWYLPQNIK